MNLPVIVSKVLGAVKGFGGKALLIGKKHAPEICMGLGVVGIAGTVAATVHATNETHDILEEREHFVGMCDEALQRGGDSYTEANHKEDMKHIRKKTRRKLFKAWWPVGTLSVGTVISFLSGYRILDGRYAATAAAYKTLEAGYERYRENVIARFGSDVDKEMMDIRPEDVAKELKKQEELERAEDEKGRKKRRKKELQQGSDIVIFDERSERWRRFWTPDMAIDHLHFIQNECNDKRMLNGHIFVNEVLDFLGLPRTCEGQVLGWIGEPVDFGLDDNSEVTVNRIRNILSVDRNCDIHIPVQLRPEGIIFDKIEKKR